MWIGPFLRARAMSSWAESIRAAARPDGWFVFTAGQVARCPCRDARSVGTALAGYCAAFVMEVEVGEVWVRGERRDSPQSRPRGRSCCSGAAKHRLQIEMVDPCPDVRSFPAASPGARP